MYYTRIKMRVKKVLVLEPDVYLFYDITSTEISSEKG